jgi:hypothetical protein
VRKSIGVCVIAVGMLLVFSASAVAATGTIEGTVVDSASKTPIEHIEVCASGAKSFETAKCALTDASGEYTLEEVPEGIYIVDFWAPPQENYLSQVYDGKSEFDEPDLVFVSSGGIVTGVDAEMQKGGSIGGRVTETGTHQPLEGAEVCVEPVGEGSFRCAETAADGTYTANRLRSGSYVVAFGDGEGNYGHLFQYYNDKPSEGAANRISLTVGQIVTGIDAELQRGAWITGTMTTDNGPARWTYVCAQTLFELYADCTESNYSGHYELGPLPPGAYKVVFAPKLEEETEGGFAIRYYNEKSSFALGDQVILTEDTVTTGVDARLDRVGKPAAIPVTTVPRTTQPRPKSVKKCRKGYRRKLVRGKRRCVRISKRKHRHRNASPA